MDGIREWAGRHPVIAYVVLAYAISWTWWAAIPLFSGGAWPIVKILVGVGLGPGLAAVLLDRWAGNGGAIGTRRWWLHAVPVALGVVLLDLSSLLHGDALQPADFASAKAPGLSAMGLLGAVASGAMVGFVFASAACSRNPRLNTITRWRAPMRWWLVAALLPAALLVAALLAAPLLGDTDLQSPLALLSTPEAALFMTRAVLFTLLVTSIGEEPGWRGWMLPALQVRHSPLVSTLVLGVVWGVWHAPLFFNGAYPGDAWDVLGYACLGPLLALPFTWLHNRTGVLLLALVLHTAVNNWQRVLPTGALFPVLFTVLAIALVIDGRMWRRIPGAHEARE